MKLKKFQSRRAQLLCLSFISFLYTASAQAKSIESIVNSITRYLQGGLARAVGVLCIIIAGYLCLWTHRFPKEYFSMVLLGLGIIFGGSTLYNTWIA